MLGNLGRVRTIEKIIVVPKESYPQWGISPIISLSVRRPEWYDFRTLWQVGVNAASAFWNRTPRDLKSHPLDSHSFLIRVTGRLERSSFVLRR